MNEIKATGAPAAIGPYSQAIQVNNFIFVSGQLPIDPATGKAYQLHHIGQKSNATLAVLTEAEHQGNASILNIVGKETEIDRNAFAAIRKQFWMDFAALFV